MNMNIEAYVVTENEEKVVRLVKPINKNFEKIELHPMVVMKLLASKTKSTPLRKLQNVFE